MIHEVMRTGGADLAPTALSTTVERNRVVSFANPYYRDLFTFITRQRSGARLNLLAFADIFSLRVWTCLALTGAAGAAAVAVAAARRGISQDLNVVAGVGTGVN